MPINLTEQELKTLLQCLIMADIMHDEFHPVLSEKLFNAYADCVWKEQELQRLERRVAA